MNGYIKNRTQEQRILDIMMEIIVKKIADGRLIKNKQEIERRIH